MEQYQLQCGKGYYWIWYRMDKNDKPKISGPHSEAMLNLPVVKIDNPLTFKPEEHPESGHIC